MRDMGTGSAPTPREGSLRDEQVERTRERILEAAIELLAEGELIELTIPHVAERAGVAVRTVYRYFATKEALIEAIALRVDGSVGPQPFLHVGGDIRALAPQLFAHFEQNLDLMRAGRQSGIGRTVFGATRRSRIASAEQALAPLLEGASEAERRQAVAIVYGLHSSATYLYYRDILGLTAEETLRAIGWAVDLVVADLEKAARKRRKAKA